MEIKQENASADMWVQSSVQSDKFLEYEKGWKANSREML